MDGGQALEREAVSTAITRLLDGARMGQGGALFVVGEAGLGKTTSLSQALVLGAPTVRVGLARGDTRETSLPFSVLATALGAVGYHASLVAPSAGAGFDDVRAAHFYGVLSWLEQAPEPMLLALDDLHWSDPDSLTLLSFVCRRLARLPVAVLATLRPWPPAAHELARALVHDGHASVHRLAPLSEDAVAAVLASRLGHPVTETVSQTAAALCAGNPSLLEQITTSISQRGQADALTGTVDADGIELVRFVGLPPGALRVAQAASVLGTRFRPALATVVAGLGEQPAEAALVALSGSGLVRQETETTAAFAYPLLCQSLYRGLPAPLRTQLHARAFRALTMRGLEAEAIEHALRADLTGDPAAIIALERAGRAALTTGAPATAVEHLHAAVRLAGDRATPALLLVLGEALLVGGRPGEAIKVYERLHKLVEVDPAERVQALRMWGRALFATAAHEQATQRFTEAAQLASKCNETAVAEVLIDDALTSWLTLGPAHSLPRARRAYELATTVPDPVRREATAAWGFVAFLNGDPAGLAASESAAGELLSGRAEHSELCRAFGPVGTFAITALLAERFADVEHALTVILAAAERAGTTEVTVSQLVTKAVLEMRQGRLVNATKVADQATELAELVPSHEGLAGAVKAEILLLLGRLDECEQWCQRIETIATSRGQVYALLQLWHVRAQLLHHAGDHVGAGVLYGRIEQLTTRMGIAEPCAVPWARHAVVTYVASDRRNDARRLIAWLERAAQRLPCRWPHIAASAGRAMLAEAEGAPATAAALYQTALALHNQAELPVEHVETMLSYGAFLRRYRQPVQARRHLATALEIAERCGAGWLADRVREELAIAGGRRRRVRDEPARLTAQEQRVARLAAAGHSNKSIAAQLTVSVKTIEFHLARVYAKLGISSRRELTTGQHHHESIRRMTDL